MPKPSLLLTLNSLIVLAITTVFVAGSIPLIVFPYGVRPFAFIGSLVFAPVVMVFGILVFRSVFSRSKTATYAVTVLYFLGGGCWPGGFLLSWFCLTWRGTELELVRQG